MTIVPVGILALLLSFGCGGKQPSGAPMTGGDGAVDCLTVLQWNLENFFDAEDDPRNAEDDSFTPSGWRQWTTEMYERKVYHLAEILDRLEGDILCFEEVENRRVLEDLAGILRTEFGQDYPFTIHRDSEDHRGVDVAVLSRFEPVTARWITPLSEQRDVLIVRFEPGGHPLTVIVNHWKSRWGGTEATAPLRRRQARAVREELDRMLDADPSAGLVVLGDFNDDFDGATMTNELASTPLLSAIKADPESRLLYNLHGELARGQTGTFYYRTGKVWNSFDTISVSASLLGLRPGPGGGWRVDRASYEVYRRPPLVTEAGYPRAFRRRKNREADRWEYEEGYSDHLPVRVRFCREGPP